MSKSVLGEIKRLRLYDALDQTLIDEIETNFIDKRIDDAKALKALEKIETNGPFSAFSESIEDEWKKLADVIVESENRLIKATKFQFYLALFELPLFIILVLVSISCGWFKQDFTSFLAIVAVIIGSVITHTYYILRIHNQATTAIERLAEKRLGILFLRIAANSPFKNVDAERLINAGTLMFLGHHGKPAEPLSSEDFPSKK